MSNPVLAAHDIVSDFMVVLTRHRYIISAESAGDGCWKVRRTGTSPVELLTSGQVEELVMDHLISAFAAQGLSDLDF
ncbi:hypothetical protein KNE206_53020 [Kitasatospora sp. NE20-6]|uniref:hypothetical protein n=1 Tax=Kitasatospora sp. NE20-6 TaxID=2859066 RepID=UPI0034DBF800